MGESPAGAWQGPDGGFFGVKSARMGWLPPVPMAPYLLPGILRTHTAARGKSSPGKNADACDPVEDPDPRCLRSLPPRGRSPPERDRSRE